MEVFDVNGLTVYKFQSVYIGTNMYVLLTDEKYAIIIDPHYDDGLLDLLTKNEIQDVIVFLTHEHPDHTIGVPWLVSRYDTHIFAHKKCAEIIQDKKNNRPVLLQFKIKEYDKLYQTDYLSMFNKELMIDSIKTDVVVDDEYSFSWLGTDFNFKFCPGHSFGSVCIYTEHMIFTGDLLIYNIPVITRFPGGSIEEYKRVTMPFFKSLPSGLRVFPGHGKSFLIKEMV